MALFAKKPAIRVRFKLAGFVDGKMMTADLELEAPEGSSVKKLFNLADKSGKLPARVMKKVMGMQRPPTVLVNGNGIDVPGELDRTLSPGDEVAVMTPLGGG